MNSPNLYQMEHQFASRTSEEKNYNQGDSPNTKAEYSQLNQMSNMLSSPNSIIRPEVVPQLAKPKEMIVHKPTVPRPPIIKTPIKSPVLSNQSLRKKAQISVAQQDEFGLASKIQRLA